MRTYPIGVFSAFFVSLLGIVAVNCGEAPSYDESEAGSGGGGGLIPEPNGERITEAVACARLESAQEARLAGLQCPPVTLRPCPDLLRSKFGAACLEYDDGSVEGCADLIRAAKTCALIAETVEACMPVHYDENPGAGCPK